MMNKFEEEVIKKHSEELDALREMSDPHIRVLYHDPACIIEKHGDWMDLRSAEDVKYKKGDFFIVSLGVSISLPWNTEGIIAARSSTFKNFHVIMTNGIGIVDNDYNGDNDVWKMPLLAMEDGEIHHGDRIAQFRVLKNMHSYEIETVDTLGNSDRGGFGSTGV